MRRNFSTLSSLTGNRRVHIADTNSVLQEQHHTNHRNIVASNNIAFVRISSKKYRMLCEHFLKRSALEKKLLVVTTIAAGCMITLVLMILFGMKNSNICTTTGCIQSAARLLEAMNMSVDPCDDFYEYACGKWSDVHFHPADEENSWFIERTRHINFLIKEILEKKESSDITPVKQMKKLYEMCMDIESLNEQGLTPLHRILRALDLPDGLPTEETANNFNLAKTLSSAQRLLNLDILVQLSTYFNSTLNFTSLAISPATNELSLLHEDRRADKTSNFEPLFSEQLIAYQLTYMVGVISQFDTAGLTVDDIVTEAIKIILLDSQLKLDIEESDETEGYFMTFTELQEYMFSNDTERSNSTPQFDWQQYLSILTENLNITLTMDSVVHVSNPIYFRQLGTRLITFKILSFQRLIWWKIVDLLAIHTTNSMRTHKFILEERFYQGLAKPTRSTHCISLTKSIFNHAIIHEFSTLYNFTEVIENVNNMMLDIEDVLKQLISSSTWMDDETKESSIHKINSIKFFIGYSEFALNSTWIIDQYKHIKIIKNEFIDTLLSIKSIQANEILSYINSHSAPESESRSWFINPTDVNAYYSRHINSIAIPVGILQFPFFVDGINAINYGAIGSILGHELSHGFDNEGKDYNWKGEIKSTWSNETITAFNNRSNCYIDQYNNYGIRNNVTIDGNNTLAENIADNGGIKEAYHAYKKYVEKNGPEPLLPGLENFTQQQLLFISFANIWCKKSADYALDSNLIDEHSPSRYRVIGSLSNFPEFSQVWNCPLNSAMNPSDKCILW